LPSSSFLQLSLLLFKKYYLSLGLARISKTQCHFASALYNCLVPTPSKAGLWMQDVVYIIGMTNVVCPSYEYELNKAYWLQIKKKGAKATRGS
jgi:hypothetical protein